MEVLVFVPIRMEIKGVDKTSEVDYVLNVMNSIIAQSELEANPIIKAEFVSEINETTLTPNETEMLKTAAGMLSADDEDDLIFMVKTIVNYDNKNEMVDYIEGVQIWNRLELQYTVKDFCKEIGYTGVEFSN